MSGLSDSAWEELSAEIDGEPVAEPLPAEPESPGTQAQTAPEATAPDVTEDAPALEASEPIVEAEAATEVDPRQAELDRREAQIAAKEWADAEKERKLAAQWQVWQEQEAEKKSNAVYQELEQVDPDLAKQFLTIKQTDSHKRREAEGRANGAERGLTAAMIALESLVDPAVFQQVLDTTGELVGYDSADQMQSAIQQKRQSAQAADADKALLEKTVRELRLQLSAQERPAHADAVDRGQSGPGSGARIEDATDFDTFFERLTTQRLPQAWQ